MPNENKNEYKATPSQSQNPWFPEINLKEEPESWTNKIKKLQWEAEQHKWDRNMIKQ